MLVALDCGCTIDDEFKNTTHEADGRHYPLGTSPTSYCPRCDLFKPCHCEGATTMNEGMQIGQARAVRLEKSSIPIPDWIIKYEPVNEPCPPGGLEEFVNGSDDEVIAAVQRLIENGRTTPSRCRIYANTQVSIHTSVQFAPSPPRTR
jgi:hypothetical protein